MALKIGSGPEEVAKPPEQKTQEYLLKKVFGDLYSQLNLEQFTDKEKGSVDIPRLAAYLEFIGFSHETIDFVSEYLEGKVDRQTALTSVEYEYKYNPNIQTKLKEFNELVKSVEKDVSGIIPDEAVRKSVAFYLSLALCKTPKIDLNSLMANISIRIDNLSLNPIEKSSILSYVMRLEFSKNTKEELSDIQEFKEKELTGDNKIICENIGNIAKNTMETYNTLISPTATEQDKMDALENYRIFLTSLGISNETANEMMVKLSGKSCGELEKEGRHKDAKMLRNIAEELADKYGMSSYDFNKNFMEGFISEVGYDISHIFDIEGVDKLVPLAISLFEFSPNYLDEYIEKVLRPMFGGTEEMQAGEAVVNQIEELRKRIEEEHGKEARKLLDELIRDTLEMAKKNLENLDKERMERVKKIIEKEIIEKTKELIGKEKE